MFGPAAVQFSGFFVSETQLRLPFVFRKAAPQHHRKFGAVLGWKAQQFRNRWDCHMSMLARAKTAGSETTTERTAPHHSLKS
jgi:hypothetical protein